MKKNSTSSNSKGSIPRVALIEWEDAQCLNLGPWVPEQETYAYTPLIVHTVAFVLHSSKEGYVFTDSVLEGGTGGLHQIPTKMIKNITWLT